MSNDSVKFLNEKCLLRCNIAVQKQVLETAMFPEHYQEHIRHQLGRMMGEAIAESAAEFTEEERPGAGERIYGAEVYVLSSADMRKLYHMIREEITQILDARLRGQ